MDKPVENSIEMLSRRIVETDNLNDARNLMMEIHMTGRIAQYNDFKPLMKQIRDGLNELNPTRRAS